LADAAPGVRAEVRLPPLEPDELTLTV
jgi:hypothetical protein